MNGLACPKQGIYEYNIGILRQYNQTNYKLINMRAVRVKGYEERNPLPTAKKNSAGNIVKLRESLSRSRSKVYELAMCNPWEHFVTLTLDGSKHDRYNLDAAVHGLAKWLNNLNYRQQANIKYLLVPEPHKDDAWHFHGLMMGIPPDMLQPFSITDKIPKHIKQLIIEGHTIYNFPLYQEAFGWVTIEIVRNNENAAKYVTKYITKELVDSKIGLNHHVFYASQGLQRSEIIYRSQLKQQFEADFENDYVRIKQYDNMEEPLKLFCDKEP